MRRWLVGLLITLAFVLGVLVWRGARPSASLRKPRTVGHATVEQRRVEPDRRQGPRWFVLAINGGGSPRENYFSHLQHLQGLIALLRKAGVPGNQITVLAGDGSDPAPDVVKSVEDLGPDAWRLRGTSVEEFFSPKVVMANSEVQGIALYPATQASWSAWLATVGPRLHAGDTLLVYVTDHGTRGAEPDGNRIVLWGEEQRLSVRALREGLGTLDGSVRVVALMSQCYSGDFAKLASLGSSKGEPSGRFCGFFSTTADRKSYGCYPETRDDPKVGHSFAFLGALPAAAGHLAQAHELILESDGTPDVPVRTSDLFLKSLLAKAANDAGMAVERVADDLLREAWKDSAFAAQAELLDRIGRHFGLPTARSHADLAKAAEELQPLVPLLERAAGQTGRAIEEMNRHELQHLLDAQPRWRASLEPRVLKATEGAGRREMAAQVTADLVALPGPGEKQRLEAAKQEQDALRQLAFRLRVRTSAVARMETVLDSVAGRSYVDRHPQEGNALRKLLDCEGLTLKLPQGGWVDSGPDLSGADEDLSEAKATLERVSAQGFLEQPAVRAGETVPELQLVPYRGEIPFVGTGKPLLLYFWATWCKACKTVVPELLELAGKGGLSILAITDESDAVLDRFFAITHEFPALVSRDPGRQTMFRLGVQEVPSFLLLDGQGRAAGPVARSLKELPDIGQ